MGPSHLRSLLDRWGSAVDVLRVAANPGADLHIPSALRKKIAALRPVSSARMEQLEERGIRVVAYGAEGYPEELRHLHHPPVVLYLKGPAELDPRRSVAVVGTRSATSYGRRMARDLAGDLARRGWSVVSGLALGIDGEAHRAALEAEGTTVGILGCGLAHVAPRRHRRLYEAVAGTGLLVSEFPPELPPEPGLFPRRNRLIAGLARAVVVVQAGAKSGALITVEHALELGREVLAVPGPVGAPVSEGVHDMLQDGAALATSAEDVVQLLEGASAAGPPEDSARRSRERDRRRVEAIHAEFGGKERAAAEELCRALSGEARAADDLALACGLDPGSATALLERLVLTGLLRGLPGGRYSLADGPRSSKPGASEEEAAYRNVT